ncbi:MAG: baseplate J/gp47 family protein [Thermomicrobiales bacterium]|nr:baseplate J/gp47 family protein [Thermomicrobiales bacterium]
MTRTITVAPGQSMSDVLAALKIAAGDELVIDIPADAAVLLTANEFRALSIAAERDDIEVAIFTDDPLRRQLATLFGVPLVNEIPEPLPYVAPELEPLAETEPYAPLTDDDEDGESPSLAPEPRQRTGGGSALRWLGGLVGLAAIVAVGVGLYWYFFSSMTVDLTLKRQNVASTLAYQVTQPGVDPAAAGDSGIVIPGQQVEFTLSRTVTAQATGQTIIPDQAATGEVVLRNPTDAAITIEQGTQFEAFSGLAYVFPDEVEVPAASDGEPGEATARVQAAEGGEAGNAAIGMLTGQLPNGVYYSNRLADIAGGTQKTITTVSQQDLDQLQAEIDKELLALATTTQLDQGLLLVSSTLQPVDAGGSATPGQAPYAFSHQVGDETGEITVTANVTFRGTAYDPTALTEAAVPQLQAEVPQGSVFDPASVRVSTPAETSNENGVIALLATVTGEAVPPLDETTRDALADQLAGKNASEIDEILAQLEYADGFSVDFAPSWLPERVPSSAGRISIESS